MQKFNAATANRKGEIVPVLITVYVDKTFDFVVKTPLVTELLCKKANIKKGSAKAGTDVVGSISKKDIEEIAKIKLPDLNSVTLDGACKIIEGSARSLGLKIVD